MVIIRCFICRPQCTYTKSNCFPKRFPSCMRHHADLISVMKAAAIVGQVITWIPFFISHFYVILSNKVCTMLRTTVSTMQTWHLGKREIMTGANIVSSLFYNKSHQHFSGFHLSNQQPNSWRVQDREKEDTIGVKIVLNFQMPDLVSFCPSSFQDSPTF